MKFIPGGTYYISAGEDGSPQAPDEDSAGVKKVMPFYLCDHEVTNEEYLDFVASIKDSGGNYLKVLPDTLCWRKKSPTYENFTEYYFRHPVYASYPVVGISYDQATAYCEWLTKKYATGLNNRYKNVQFKLPTLSQWTFAAKGGLDLCPFPWKGIETKDSKGHWLANFRMIYQQGIRKSTLLVKGNDYMDPKAKEYLIAIGGDPTGHYLTKKSDDLTVPVKSYAPNGYGLYDMAGNVEEYVERYGITKGGSWDDTGYYLMTTIHKTYDSNEPTSCSRGFRIAMEIKNQRVQ